MKWTYLESIDDPILVFDPDFIGACVDDLSDNEATDGQEDDDELHDSTGPLDESQLLSKPHDVIVKVNDHSEVGEHDGVGKDALVNVTPAEEDEIELGADHVVEVEHRDEVGHPLVVVLRVLVSVVVVAVYPNELQVEQH